MIAPSERATRLTQPPVLAGLLRRTGRHLCTGLLLLAGIGSHAHAQENASDTSKPSGSDAAPAQAPALPTELPKELPTELPTALPEGLPEGLSTEPPAGLPTELPAALPTEIPPGLPLDKLPEAPKPPSLPGPLGDILKASPDSTAPSSSTGGPFPPGTRTRLEIDHRKKAVVLPRLGLLYTLQPNTLPVTDPNSQTLPTVMQTTLGAELQLGIRKTWYATAELQGLYILSGGYGLGDGGDPDLLRFGEGSLTTLTGLGLGRFTQFLDAYGLWSRVALKAGYLYPYYGLLWLNADVSREFQRTPQHYWDVSVSPSVGLLLPVDARGTEIFQRIGLMAGLQLSAAFIFAPLGG